MKTYNIVLEMLKMQQKLNDETNGLGWENGWTKNNKLVNWRRCIYMECAELIDSFPWKHWKNINAPINKENIRVEIVDIWHFILSLFLQINHNQNSKNIEQLAQDICDSSGFARFCKEPLEIFDDGIYDIVNNIEMLIHECSGFNYDIYHLLKIYFEIALKCGVNLLSLYECYVAKNVLNVFRQNNGYKEGTYRKNWNGIEDNIVMIEILQKQLSLNKFNIDDIYLELEEKYRK